MGNKRTRDRQLAKQAARRREQRYVARRKRTATIFTGVGIGLFAIVIGFLVFTNGGKDQPAAGPTPTAAATEPAQNTVVPVVEPPTKVACGAKAPSAARKPKPQFAQPPKMTIDPDKTYEATMRTSCGDIVIDLLADGAPETVNSFAFLADGGFYDGVTFHRIVPGFVIQGGDPLGDGTGGPGYQYKNEMPRGEAYDGPGILAMANSGVDTNGSQFFITLAKSDALTPDLYTIFGRVIDGQDVVDAIAKVPLKGETPTEAVYIDLVKVRES
ncbi:MAG: peptidylprolyl isomerase [Actinomycetota bacterium]